MGRRLRYCVHIMLVCKEQRQVHAAEEDLVWMDNIKTCTGLPVEESIKMTEDRDKWRKYVHGVANPRIDDGYRTEQIMLV